MGWKQNAEKLEDEILGGVSSPNPFDTVIMQEIKYAPQF